MLSKFIKRFSVIALAVLLSASLAGCSFFTLANLKEYLENYDRIAESPDEAPDPSDSPKDDGSGKKYYPKKDDGDPNDTSESIHLDVPSASGVFELPEYYRYDDAFFLEECINIAAAALIGDTDEIIRLFEELDGELKVIDSLYTSAEIRGDRDVTVSTWSDELTYCEETYYSCHNALYTALRGACEVCEGDALREYFGDEEYENILEFEKTPEEIIEMELRLTELENEYDEELNNCYSMTYTYKGKSYTIEDLMDDSINDLVYSDYAGYVKVYYGVLKNFNDVLGPIYLEMIKIRADIAQYYGYETFADYAYAEIYGRDYTTKDAEEYCEIIKKYVAGDYFDCYYDTDFSAASYSDDTDDILSAFGNVLKSMGDDFYDAYLYFTESGTYDIGYSEERIDGCYTTYFSNEGVPYIFINTYGDGSGFSSLTHEFGHYLNWLIEDPEEAWTEAANYDIMEIQSNSLELLSTNFYDGIYGDDADEAESYELLTSLYQVVYGCIYDEFQRRVYENPDMTLDEINELFATVSSEYGEYELYDYDYTWVLVGHNFSSPMYYISYSVSSLGALNVWSASKENLSSAIDLYRKILTLDDGCEGLLEFEEKCGLTLMTDASGIRAVCAEALQFINTAYSSGSDIWDYFGDWDDDSFFGDFWDDFYWEDYFSPYFDYFNTPEPTKEPEKVA